MLTSAQHTVCMQEDTETPPLVTPSVLSPGKHATQRFDACTADCWQVRVAYGRIAVRPDGMCEIDVFVQEVDGMRIHDECAPAAGPRAWQSCACSLAAVMSSLNLAAARELPRCRWHQCKAMSYSRQALEQA